MRPESAADLAERSAAAFAARDFATASELSRRTSPVHDLLGLAIVEVDDDGAVFTMELTDAVRGSAVGTVHGGLLATFADAASAMSLSGRYDSTAEIPVTTDMHIRYYRQPTAGPLTALATVVHRGRRLLSTECRISDADNRVLARSTATYMLAPLQT